jgi:hypothetical protein
MIYRRANPIQEVFDKSPAQKAGLIPHEDYLLGTHDVVLKGMDDLQYLISKYTNQVAIEHVYNTFNKNVREVGQCRCSSVLLLFASLEPWVVRAIFFSVFSQRALIHFEGVSPQVRLDLKERWSGQGRLGCDVGHGLLHRLPTFNVVASINADVAAEAAASDDYLEPPSIEVMDLSI